MTRGRWIMMRSVVATSALACVLALGMPSSTVALTASDQNPVNSIGKAVKDAGKATVKGTKGVVKKAGEVTEDAVEKTAKETKNVGKRVEGAVSPDLVSAKCRDGKVRTGRTKAEACYRHGGIK
jgi:hypothetical protein